MLPAMSGRQLRGSCLCGSAKYTVRDAFEYSFICHCSQCRRATGAGSKPFAGISADKLLLPEHNRLTRYGDDDASDAHCSRCGSLLCSMVQNGAFAHVTLGTLVDEPSIRPSAHIFTASKASWDLICDDLPQFEALPPE
jgi:hypothetical protein